MPDLTPKAAVTALLAANMRPTVDAAGTPFCDDACPTEARAAALEAENAALRAAALDLTHFERAEFLAGRAGMEHRDACKICGPGMICHEAMRLRLEWNARKGEALRLDEAELLAAGVDKAAAGGEDTKP